MDLYVDDRLARQSVSKEKPVDKLLDKTEELYADNYSGGDIEDARRNLRAGDIPTTYYDNVYPAAFMVGLGLPPVVLGIVKCASSVAHF
jgi:hypothetical protein